MNFIHQPPESLSILNTVNTFLKWRNANGPPRLHEEHHPSQFGKCLRKQQYQYYLEKGYLPAEKVRFEDYDGKILRLFETGHFTQDRWRTYFEAMGVLRGVWSCDNPLCMAFLNPTDFDGAKISSPSALEHPRIYGLDNKIGVFKPKSCVCGCSSFSYHEISVRDEELNFGGHTDFVLDYSNFKSEMFKQGVPIDIFYKDADLPKKPMVIDMKTINSNQFKYKLSNGPHDEYVVQLTIYINILGCDLGALIYENKDTSEVKVFAVHKNEKDWENIKQQAVQMKEMRANKQLPPPKPLTKDDSECEKCMFKKICHASTVWDKPDLESIRKNFYGSLLRQE